MHRRGTCSSGWRNDPTVETGIQKAQNYVWKLESLCGERCGPDQQAEAIASVLGHRRRDGPAKRRPAKLDNHLELKPDASIALSAEL
jgi:hypothetical protein